MEKHFNDMKKVVDDAIKEETKVVVSISPNDLTELLKQAKEAHTRYEQTNPPKHEWEKWYANFILNKLNNGQTERLSEFLHEIKDQSLQNILREVLLSGANIFEVEKKHRPEL